MRTSADKQVPEKHRPYVVKIGETRGRKARAHFWKTSNEGTNETVYVAAWPQQGRLYIDIILTVQNGQLCLDFLAPGSIRGQEL